MKLPLNWLREWVDIPWPPAELASRLTLAGFEVESLEPAAPPFSGVVVAQIVEASQHPQADKLRVCKVITATGEAPRQIVCGAANARAGLKVALAEPGAKLPGGVDIKAAQLRGVESAGMLCSAKELGLLASAEGIVELPADAPLGASLRDALDLDDPIIEVSIYANRGDAMSVSGLAREVAALTGRPPLRPATATATAIVAVAQVGTHPVHVDAPLAAPRLLSRVLRDIDNRAVTPAWMQERLRRSGLRPISPVVDVTNYVMLELGQPMHAYDLARLQGAMHVRMAVAGETLELLDGRRIELSPDVLVIADGQRSIGLAGVMGGQGTAITDAVTDVLLEVAFFSPEYISGRARRYGLQTDASQRFERGVDPRGQEAAIERAAQLITSICGGNAGPVSIAEEPSAIPLRRPIHFRRDRLAKLVGTELSDEKVTAALRLLEMQVTASADGWQVTPPSWRFDIELEADLVEEVIRLIGYDQVPEAPALQSQKFRSRPEAVVPERAVLDVLVARGYQECINYAFVDETLQQRLFPEATAIRLANPIASDLAVMRVSLWPGLLKVALENQRRQADRVRLFELGAVYELHANYIVEPHRLAGLAFGPRWPEQWGAPRELFDFFDLKADVMAILDLSGQSELFDFNQESIPALHPGRTAGVWLAGQRVGWLGELHPVLTRELQFPTAPLLFELDINSAARANLPAFAPISRFPQVRRDLSVTVPEATPLSAIESRVSVAAGHLLREMRIFDVYQGPGIETGRKSIALGLIFQDNNRTLKEDEADQLMAGIATDLQAALDAKMRE